MRCTLGRFRLLEQGLVRRAPPRLERHQQVVALPHSRRALRITRSSTLVETTTEVQRSVEGAGAVLLPSHHLHYVPVVPGAHWAGGSLFLATFCALSVTLGALLYSLSRVLAEYFTLQQQLAVGKEEKHVLYGVDVSGSPLFKHEKVLEAVEFAASAHVGQVRKTGEPYVTHCIETALIVERNLPRWREDSRHVTAVIAAVLHDTLDDTATDISTIAERFGHDVAAMVATVSKLSQVNQVLRRDKRKGVNASSPQYWRTTWQKLKRMMFEAVTEEPLVVLVKLADRLHNMRTVYALAPEKQHAVAEETLEVWCSMAECLGWDGLKSEMEDLCFAVMDPDGYCSLRQQLDALWSDAHAPTRRRRWKGTASRRAAQQRQRAGQDDAAAATAQREQAEQQGRQQPLVQQQQQQQQPRQHIHSHLQHHKQQQQQQQQQQRKPPLAPLLGAPEAAAMSARSPAPAALLPAPPHHSSAPSLLVQGVTDAAVSLQTILGSRDGGAGSSGRDAAAARPARPVLTPQQEQLRMILSMVVPFNAVSFKSAKDLAWSARRGLEELDACANKLYEDLSIGSFGSGLDVTIQGRLKSLRSVERKMKRKNCTLEEVYDARALRVIVDDCGGERMRDAAQTCYRLVAAVHKTWKPIAFEFDDYIANPKPSGYQALHTAVWGPGGIAMEVQIKTSSMHEHAEFGGAAHWVYKEQVGQHGIGAPALTAAVEAAAEAAAAEAQAQVQEMQPGKAGQHGSGSGQQGAGESGGQSESGQGEVVVEVVDEGAWAGPREEDLGASEYGMTPASSSSSSPAAAAAGEAPGAAGAPRAAWHDNSAAGGSDTATASSSHQQQQQQQQDQQQASRQGPQPRPQLCYVGQPVLRTSDRLRYGVVLASERQGSMLLVCIMNGATMDEHPMRVPDYAFYDSLRQYAVDHGWHSPGQGDLRARLEEFVLCKDGRYHRKDHMEYLHPNTTITLLEGYERDAAALAEAAAAAAAAADATAADATDAAAAAAGAATTEPAAQQSLAKPAKAAAQQSKTKPATAVPPPPLLGSQAERDRARLQQQWHRTAVKAAQLRSVIEWGRTAYGDGEELQSDEVSVVIWPGGQIQDFPRGTTAGQILRQQRNGGFGTKVPARQVAVAGVAAAAPARGSEGSMMVMVNNRLVHESTVLGDGDLITLTTERLNI